MQNGIWMKWSVQMVADRGLKVLPENKGLKPLVLYIEYRGLLYIDETNE